MPKTLDLTGKRFGRLTVICIDHIGQKNGVYWRCKCDCGNETVVLSYKLKRGNAKSCGCLEKEIKSNIGNMGTSVIKKYLILGTRVNNSLRKSDLCTMRTNKSGYTGAFYCKSRNQWVGQCEFQGYRYRKYFNNKEDAIQFRKLMKEKRDEFIKWYDSLTSEEKETLTNDDKMYFKSLFKSKMDELFDKEVLNK